MSKRRRVAAALGIVLGVYVLLAALPYAFPPAAERAQAAFVPVEDGAAGDRATILTTGEEALAARLNLIANAVRAAGEGGESGLRLARRGGRAVLTVWDNGPGFLPETDERELLQRPGSLGLGLKVARRIAALHGGSIVFEQREERGSRAIVSLPLRPPEPGELLKTPRMGFDGSGGFSDTLIELAGVLPYRAFFPEDVE